MKTINNDITERAILQTNLNKQKKNTKFKNM